MSPERSVTDQSGKNNPNSKLSEEVAEPATHSSQKPTSEKENAVPHIEFPEGVPGIRSAMAFRTETAVPLSELAEVSCARTTRSAAASAS